MPWMEGLVQRGQGSSRGATEIWFESLSGNRHLEEPANTYQVNMESY